LFEFNNALQSGCTQMSAEEKEFCCKSWEQSCCVAKSQRCSWGNSCLLWL